MYIYGGQKNSTENTDELYEYNFETEKFTLIKPTSSINPPPLDSHCVNLWKKDANTETMIINCGFIGGKVGAYTSSVWEFNFSDSEWAQLFSHKIKFNKKDPVGRMGAGSAIVGNSLFIFGGTDSNKRFNDLWEFDLITKIWKEIAANDNIPEVIIYV